MILAPTSVTLNGKRVWLEGSAKTPAEQRELDAALASVDYQAKNGIPMHIQHNDKLPKKESIIDG